MPITDQTRLALAADVTFQGLGPRQETVILSLASGYLFTCSETTAALLRAVDGRRTVAELVDLLLREYDVLREKLRADVLSMAAQLVEKKLLVVADDGPARE